MADQPLIPPVTNSAPLPRRHSDTGKGKVKSGNEQKSRQKQQKKDDGKPHIDEFA